MDKSLIEDIQDSERNLVENTTNGYIAKQMRDLRHEIILDNKKKKELRIQLAKCAGAK